MGHVTYVNGETYHGMFRLDAMEGRGVYTSPNEHWKYDGHFESNRFNGHGNVTYFAGPHQGTTYEGEFAGGVYHGMGTMRFGPNGSSTYIGDFEKGKRHGLGTLLQKGTRLECRFVQGFADGEGKEFDEATGALIRQGTWKQGTFTGTK